MQNPKRGNPVVIDQERALRAKSADRDEIDEILGVGEILTDEGAKILATIEDRGLDLNGLREISATSFVEIATKKKNYIELNRLTKLPEDFEFEELNLDEFDAHFCRVIRLALNGLKELNENQIRFIGSIPVENLELKSIVKLNDKEGWRIAVPYCCLQIDLSGLSHAPIVVLENLIQSVGSGFLNLSGLRSIDEEQAKVLAKLGSDFEYGSLSLGVRKFTSLPIAQNIAEFQGGDLLLDKLEEISSEIAEVFAEKFEGQQLSLNNVRKIGEDAFKALVTGNLSGIPDGQVSGWLDLNSLQELTTQMAKCLEGNEIMICLNGLLELSIDIAEILVQSKGRIVLQGVIFINDQVADVLSRNVNAFSFNKNVIVSDSAREKLGKAIC